MGGWPKKYTATSMSSLAFQVNAGAEQTAVTRRELARLAEHQQGLVGRFKVR
jgi:methyl-accepting chemotaxis protein